MIKVINGTYGYSKENIILDNINFFLDKKEVLSILGSNGVGKTTLIKTIMGLLKWNNGNTILDGKDIDQMSKKEIWSKISYVPQKRSFPFSYTGLEMVLLGLSVNLSVFNSPGKKEFEKSKKVMKDLDIYNLKDKPINIMSGGELQMIMIARALVSEPKVLILDEPESGLDFKNQLMILELIRELKSIKDISSIVNTHYPDNALRISDKCLILNRDKSYKLGKINEILNRENIKETFGVETVIADISTKNRKYKTIYPLDIAR
ncbi:MAG: ABC transporter ATP-binding protein [Tissierellia bacterium]|nr:ABC transporter ATP-binding protein [Tissierellia bacterium]